MNMNLDTMKYGFGVEENGKQIGLKDLFNRYFIEEDECMPLNKYQKDLLKLMEGNNMIVIHRNKRLPPNKFFGKSIVNEIMKLQEMQNKKRNLELEKTLGKKH